LIVYKFSEMICFVFGTVLYCLWQHWM